MPEVLRLTGHESRVTVWRLYTAPTSDFPRPVQLGPNAIGFYEDEIVAYVNSRPRVVSSVAPEDLEGAANAAA